MSWSRLNRTVPLGSLQNGIRSRRIHSSIVRGLTLRNSAASALVKTALSLEGNVAFMRGNLHPSAWERFPPKFDGYLSESIRSKYFNSASRIPARRFAASDFGDDFPSAMRVLLAL